jgi:hypothetical protein
MTQKSATSSQSLQTTRSDSFIFQSDVFCPLRVRTPDLRIIWRGVYVIAHYVTNPHSFNWHGKPFIFSEAPIVGNGRTLATWGLCSQPS